MQQLMLRRTFDPANYGENSRQSLYDPNRKYVQSLGVDGLVSNTLSCRDLEGKLIFGFVVGLVALAVVAMYSGKDLYNQHLFRLIDPMQSTYQQYQ